MLPSVQAYRGIAVLLVVLFHSSEFIKRKLGEAPFGDVFLTGFSGVFLFFVLSGFIILIAHARDIGRPGRIGYYLSRRFIRIYPLYWLVLLSWGGWRVFTGGLAVPEFLSNAWLFSGRPTPLIAVSWTLAYEMLFYALFAAFLLRRSWGLLVFAGWLALLLPGTAIIPGPWADPLNLLFFMGMAAGVVHLKASVWDPARRNRIGLACLTLGATGFVATGRIYAWLGLPSDAWPAHPLTLLGFGFSSALMLAACMAPELNRLLARRRLWLLVGNASYAIYLVHLSFGKLAWSLSRPLQPLWSELPAVWAANLLTVWLAGLSVLAGILVHLMIEAPLLDALRGLLARKWARQPAAAVSG